ncbi:MAG: pyridoxamine 5'-phosphate oxidase family protein [Candidatus Hodarchaeota archaeon]
MKLGSMQPSKKYKFLQEQVFDGILFFNRFKSPINVFMLLLLYIIWGVFLYIIYRIPLSYLVAGLCGAIGLFLWTIGIFHYANRLRNVEIERINKVNQKFLVNFLENMFHPSSIIISVIVFISVVTYGISSTSLGIENILTKIQRDLNFTSLPLLLTFFIMLLAFDLCYRLGLSFYVILTQIRRNYRLSKYLKNPLLRTQFSPTDIRKLEESDYSHFLAIGSGFFLVPLGFLDYFLLRMLLLYLFIAFSLTFLNLLHLRLLYVRSIPKGFLNLISTSKFTQVSTVSNGIPHITPTLFVFDGRNFFIATSIKSRKIKNLRKNKKLTIFISSQSDKDLTKSIGVMISGRSKVYGYNFQTGIYYHLLLGVLMIRIYLLFFRKYPNYLRYYWRVHRSYPSAWRLFPILSRTIIEIVPEQFFSWKSSRPNMIKF